ncbi:MAG: S-adenosyl-methyltransferase MraW [uncultured bacterium]|nr:MAG: S-adenosyl-methyltransferase MraW [uncultured bacterium]HLD44754.1 16S rRNA (cytosine(1402)-N(4))-methyltransferase RsmH [bacterium]
MNGHESVLLKTTIDSVVTRTDGLYLDCTGGWGGHSIEILSRLTPGGKLWICDYHVETVKGLANRIAHDERATVICSRFSQVFDNLNFSFDGIIADLGISSVQLADPNLGIGFQLDNAPLDMRLDHRLTTSAADILSTHDASELADIFFYWGGERASRKIASAIVFDRNQGKHYTHTKQLKELCERVLGRYYHKKKIHPATKIFQALRIAVNHEIDELKTLLETAPHKLSPGGKLAVISFHSGEDGLVKKMFKDLAQTEDFQLAHKKAIKPDDTEIQRNPRARSARLRVLTRTP